MAANPGKSNLEHESVTKARRQSPRLTKKGKDRSQQDSVWKELLEELFELFMAFFFPNYHQRLDWSRPYVSLDKEMIEVTQQSGFTSRSADKLFKMFFKDGETALILLHVEVQGYKDESFTQRVHTYNELIRRKYNINTDSFAVLTDPDKHFMPDFYLQKDPDHIHYYKFPVVKLLDYWKQWAELEQDPNPFALVVMAHLKAQRLRRRPIELKEAIVELLPLCFGRGYNREFVIRLIRFIDGIVRLPSDLEKDFRVEVAKYIQEVDMPFVSGFELLAKEEGRQEGRQEGLREGTLHLVLMQLGARFSSITPELKSQIASLNINQLEDLGLAQLKFAQLEDLTAWLASHVQ